MLSPQQLIGSTDSTGFVLGGDITMKVQIVDKYTNAPAGNVSGTIGASAQFGNADGTVLTKTLGAGITVLDASEAVFSVKLSRTESAALLAGPAQSWQFSYIGGDAVETVVTFDQMLELIPRVF